MRKTLEPTASGSAGVAWTPSNRVGLGGGNTRSLIEKIAASIGVMLDKPVSSG